MVNKNYNQKKYCSLATQLELPAVSKNILSNIINFRRKTNKPKLSPIEREKAWVTLLSEWSDFAVNNRDYIKSICRDGIPPSVRSQGWLYLTNADQNLNINDYLLKAGDPKIISQIEKDIHRQFPNHQMFSDDSPYGKNGQQNLFSLLKAYTVLYPRKGYCQAQAPIASMLLMQMPIDDAFRVFDRLCLKYAKDYYTDDLKKVQVEGEILKTLMNLYIPDIYHLFEKKEVEPHMYIVEWFLCLFARTFTPEITCRIWDILFSEGTKILFQTALVILKHTFTPIDRSLDTMDILSKLKQLPQALNNANYLIGQINEMKIEKYDLLRVHFEL
uniref:Rab-GAP TBC domain-containing protein n=1 Tax=Rhabditophanes sp. KR3021 TaxID=114890 RepID=A0AC35TIU2_9BILA